MRAGDQASAVYTQTARRRLEGASLQHIPIPPPPPLRRATPLLTSRACPTIFVRLPAGPPQPILTPSAYFAALGKLVESVLSRILTDVEDLDDISEVESTRLAELCRMLQPLEELFVEPSTGVSAVE